MATLKIKKGDTVIVLAGNSKDNKPHRVLEILPEQGKAIVEGVNIVSKSTKPNANAPQGGIIKKEAPIDLSNLAVVDPKTGKPQIPRLVKIVLNEGLGDATQDKKIIETAINELTAITGQKAVQTLSKKDISNFKVRKKMPIGVRVTLRRDRMYEFMERFIRIALPRIRDFKGVPGKLDGRGNYTVGVTEQIIFPEINIDNVTKMTGMNITFVTTAKTDEEGYALLKEFGIPFNNK